MPNEFDNFRDLSAWAQDMGRYLGDNADITLPDSFQVGEMMAEPDPGKRMTALGDKVNELLDALRLRQSLTFPSISGTLDLVNPLQLLQDRAQGLDYVTSGGDVVVERVGHTVTISLNRQRLIQDIVASSSPIEFGRPQQNFTSGDTITLLLCDENGIYKNGDNTTNPETGAVQVSEPTSETPIAKVFLGPNRGVVGQTFVTADIITWMRFQKPTDPGAVVGVLAGLMSGLPIGQGPYKYLEVAEDMSVAWDYARFS